MKEKLELENLTVEQPKKLEELSYKIEEDYIELIHNLAKG